MKNRIFIILALLLILPFSSCAHQETPTANKPNLPEAQSPNMSLPAPSIFMPSDPDAELKKIVIKSDLIVLGEISDKRYEVVTAESGNTTGKFTYTIFTLSIEEVIKGDLTTKQVFIKTIEPYFLIKDRILTLLNRGNDNYYTLAGLQWFESPSTGAYAVVKLQEAIGRIIKIMKENDIPIALKITYLPPPPPPVPSPAPAAPSPPDIDQPQPKPQPAPTTFRPSLPPTPIDPISELTDIVEKAALIVLGTITDKRYEVRAEIQYDKSTRDYIYTIFTLTVEKVIKGDPNIKEVFVETAGGLWQTPSGWYFSIGNRGLISLYRKNNYYKVLYLLWGESTMSVKVPWSLPTSNLQEIIGLIIRIAKDNNIPVALPESEWPPIPAYTTLPKGN